jgi:3-oxoacyl-[acyl-carrier-protein] synthase III
LDGNTQFVSSQYGNVVGSAIPFQILAESKEAAATESTESTGQNLFLLAFGVGLTLAGIVIKESSIPENASIHD